MSISKIAEYILGLPKTIYVNFRLCSFSDACKLPIFVSRKTKIQSLSGTVEFYNIRPAMVRVGFGSVENFDFAFDRTLLNVEGKLRFSGKCKIGFGSKVSVKHGGVIEFGENFHISAAANIICCRKVKIEDSVLMSWNSMIMDSDHHHIYDYDSKKRINLDQTIIIGKHSWIGASAFILKGVNLPEGSIVGANSVITKSFEKTHCVIAGNPAKITKENVYWVE